MLSRLFEWVRPRSVADVGCGVGTWLRAAQALGAELIVGFDGDYVDRAQLQIPSECFIPTALDWQRPAERLPADRQKFDLVISMEVAEHLPYAQGPGFVDALVELGDLVLFSAAIPYQHGTGHINEQWPEYWASLFRSRGFRCFDPLRRELWGNPEVEWWYAQNVLLFARADSASAVALPVESECTNQGLGLVHPLNLLRQTLWNFRPLRRAAREVEEGDYITSVNAWRDGTNSPPDLRAPILAAEALPGTQAIFPNTRTVMSDPEVDLDTLRAELLAVRSELEVALANAGEATRAADEHAAELASSVNNLASRLAMANSSLMEADHCLVAQKREVKAVTSENTLLQNKVISLLADLEKCRADLEATNCHLTELKNSWVWRFCSFFYRRHERRV